MPKNISSILWDPESPVTDTLYHFSEPMELESIRFDKKAKAEASERRFFKTATLTFIDKNHFKFLGHKVLPVDGKPGIFKKNGKKTYSSIMPK